MQVKRSHNEIGAATLSPVDGRNLAIKLVDHAGRDFERYRSEIDLAVIDGAV